MHNAQTKFSIKPTVNEPNTNLARRALAWCCFLCNLPLIYNRAVAAATVDERCLVMRPPAQIFRMCTLTLHSDNTDTYEYRTVCAPDTASPHSASPPCNWGPSATVAVATDRENPVDAHGLVTAEREVPGITLWILCDLLPLKSTPPHHRPEPFLTNVPPRLG